MSLPVLPTWTLIPSSLVTACSASYLKAIVQRGLLLRAPSRSRWLRSSTLTTRPSVWKSSVLRSVAPALGVLDHLLDRVVAARVGADRDAPALHQLGDREIRRFADPLVFAQAVRDEPQPALGDEPGVEQLERAGRRVAGIGERGLAGGARAAR